MLHFFYFFFALCVPILICEGKKNDTGSRIVGGYATYIDYYYWQVSLQIQGFHICGGSIITQNVVITAAHCIDAQTLQSLNIYAGSTFKSIKNQVRSVRGYAIHPEYNKVVHLDYDIALLQVNAPFVWTNQVYFIPLTTYEPGGNTYLFVSGWGRTSNSNQNSPDQLQGTTLVVQSRTSCTNSWGAQFTPRMICAVASGTDICSGDSGGPGVIYDYSTNKYVLAGLVSWGLRDYCASGIPSGFTNVANLRPWIKLYTGF